MSDDRRTCRPEGVLQEYPHPGPHGHVHGLGCGEVVRGEDARRYYRRKAHRKARAEERRLIRQELEAFSAELREDAKGWEERLHDEGLYFDDDWSYGWDDDPSGFYDEGPADWEFPVPGDADA